MEQLHLPIPTFDSDMTGQSLDLAILPPFENTEDTSSTLSPVPTQETCVFEKTEQFSGVLLELFKVPVPKDLVRRIVGGLGC